MNSYLYWTDWGSPPKIGRISTDGKNITDRFITEKLGWPNAMAVDCTTGRLWWGDAHLDIIELVVFYAFFLSHYS